MVGRGTEKDYVLAHMWFDLDRTHGNKNGARGLELVIDDMTKEQIEEAQKMTREWRENHFFATAHSASVACSGRGA